MLFLQLYTWSMGLPLQFFQIKLPLKFCLVIHPLNIFLLFQLISPENRLAQKTKKKKKISRESENVQFEKEVLII